MVDVKTGPKGGENCHFHSTPQVTCHLSLRWASIAGFYLPQFCQGLFPGWDRVSRWMFHLTQKHPKVWGEGTTQGFIGSGSIPGVHSGDTMQPTAILKACGRK